MAGFYAAVSTKSTKILWLSFGEYRGNWFTSLGSHTLAGYIRQRCSQELEQAAWYYSKTDEKSLHDTVVSNPLDFICLSVNLGYFEEALRLVSQILNWCKKEQLARPQFVFGNREFENPKYVRRLLDTVPEAIIVMGEGEEAICDIVERLPLEQIPNVVTRRNGKELQTPRTIFPPEHYVAPYFDLPIINALPLDLNHEVAFIEVSRGCSKRPSCSFCSNSSGNFGQWRALNLTEVISAIRKIATFTPATINFVSEDFMGENSSETQKFLDLLTQLKATKKISPITSFYCAIRTTDVFHHTDSIENRKHKRDILQQMRNLGFTTLYVGLESGSTPQLRRYCKGINRIDNLKAIQVLRKLDFHIDGGFIMFDPLMSLDDALENIEFMRQSSIPKLHLFPFNCLIPYPGTAYFRMMQRKNIESKTQRLLKIIEIINTHIPYAFLELFTQNLRRHYFANNNQQMIASYEIQCIAYGSLCLNFLEKIILYLKHSILSKDVEAEMLQDFLNKHHCTIVSMRSWFERVKMNIGTVPRRN